MKPAPLTIYFETGRIKGLLLTDAGRAEHASFEGTVMLGEIADRVCMDDLHVPEGNVTTPVTALAIGTHMSRPSLIEVQHIAARTAQAVYRKPDQPTAEFTGGWTVDSRSAEPLHDALVVAWTDPARIFLREFYRAIGEGRAYAQTADTAKGLCLKLFMI